MTRRYPRGISPVPSQVDLINRSHEFPMTFSDHWEMCRVINSTGFFSERSSVKTASNSGANANCTAADASNASFMRRSSAKRSPAMYLLYRF